MGVAVVELFCAGSVGLLVWLLVVSVGVVFLTVVLFATWVECRGLAGVLVILGGFCWTWCEVFAT